MYLISVFMALTCVAVSARLIVVSRRCTQLDAAIVEKERERMDAIALAESFEAAAKNAEESARQWEYAARAERNNTITEIQNMLCYDGTGKNQQDFAKGDSR